MGVVMVRDVAHVIVDIVLKFEELRYDGTEIRMHVVHVL